MHFPLVLFYDESMSKRLVIGVSILTIFIVLVAIFLAASRPLSQTPTPQPQHPQQQEIDQACRDFEAMEHPVSCQEAVTFALEQAQGTVQNVSIGNVTTSTPASSGDIEIQAVEMWLVDIRLANPYFDEEFNKEISVIQIGTPLEHQNVQYQKPLE